MSSVRMCDVRRDPSCMRFFSELEEGWQTFRGSTVKTNALTGQTEAVQTAMDACPRCAVQSTVKEGALEKLARRFADMPDEQLARIVSAAADEGHPEPTTPDED